MRGLFTCGVIDVFLENGIEFDGAIGVSAGASFGCNFKSKQIGRVLRYTGKFCKDYRFGSIKSWLKHGSVFEPEFCYIDIPYKYDLFDEETYRNNPMDFYCVCTDVKTGEPLYKLINKGDKEDVKYIAASSSMPLVSKTVKVDNLELLDGGISDSVPIRYFESIGYDKNVVILTQPSDYVKNPQKMIGLFKLFYPKNEGLVKAMKDRHIGYNETLEYIKGLETSGELFVLRPDEKLNINPFETDHREYVRVYEEGRKCALKNLNRLKEYLR